MLELEDDFEYLDMVFNKFDIFLKDQYGKVSVKYYNKKFIDEALAKNIVTQEEHKMMLSAFC